MQPMQYEENGKPMQSMRHESQSLCDEEDESMQPMQHEENGKPM